MISIEVPAYGMLSRPIQLQDQSLEELGNSADADKPMRRV